MKTRKGILQAGLVGAVLVALAGCGASSKGGTGDTKLSASGVPTVPASKATGFADATTERNKLLALAKPGTKITSQGTVPGWPPANGSGIPATPTEISGFSFNSDSAAKLQFLSFAVGDSGGHCAGGDIVANSKGTTVVSATQIKLPPHAACTGDEVAKLAGHG